VILHTVYTIYHIPRCVYMHTAVAPPPYLTPILATETAKRLRGSAYNIRKRACLRDNETVISAVIYFEIVIFKLQLYCIIILYLHYNNDITYDRIYFHARGADDTRDALNNIILTAVEISSLCYKVS